MKNLPKFTLNGIRKITIYKEVVVGIILEALPSPLKSFVVNC